MLNFLRLDTILRLLFFLVLPLLLFTTTSLLFFSLSSTTLTAFQSGLCGFLVGGIITFLLGKFIKMNVFDLPPILLISSYFVYSFFFYTILQGIPLLVFTSGILTGLYYRRSFVVLQKPSDEYDFRVFQLSFLTAVTIGILSLITSCLIYFNVAELDYLRRIEAWVDPFPRPLVALSLVTCCAILAHIQFLLTKMTLLFNRPC